MKKLSNIMESIWSDMQDRGTGEIKKKEDAIKVHTCLDVDIFVSADCDYDSAIQYILNHFIDDDSIMFVVNVRDSKYTPDEMVNIRKWQAPYTYMIYEGGSGTDLILDFEPYDTLVENEYEICEYVSEKDYPAICRGIAEKMKQFGGNISYVHNKAWVINGDHRDIEKYMYNYAFKLIDEGDVSYWTSEEENENRSDYVNEFIEDMQHSFGAIIDQDFIGWNFNNYGGISFPLPINFDNIINLKDYIEYTEKWFEVK